LGFTLALDDVLEITPAIRALLPLVDIVKFILMRDWEKQAERIVHDLQGFPVRLLAERVETPEQFKKCAALGFSLFQGYFFAYPTVLHGRKLGQDRSILVTLLNQILNDVDTKVLEKTFKSAPGLSVNLLRLTNSVAFGGHAQIISLGHAITILGRQQLRRWLQLLLFSSSDNRKQLADNPLLHLAATRAYLMEKLVLTQKIGGPIVAEQAFLIGIMSLVPVILDMSMEEILEQLSNLPSSIHDALLKHDGRLGKLLLLVKNLEKDDPSEGDFSTHLFGFPGLKLSVLNSLHCEALAWASQLGQPMNSGLPRNRTLNPDYA
jgi:EAL and modified HD-GYP domain-containing signal transduction protein